MNSFRVTEHRIIMWKLFILIFLEGLHFTVAPSTEEIQPLYRLGYGVVLQPEARMYINSEKISLILKIPYLKEIHVQSTNVDCDSLLQLDQETDLIIRMCREIKSLHDINGKIVMQFQRHIDDILRIPVMGVVTTLTPEQLVTVLSRNKTLNSNQNYLNFTETYLLASKMIDFEALPNIGSTRVDLQNELKQLSADLVSIGNNVEELDSRIESRARRTVEKEIWNGEKYLEPDDRSQKGIDQWGAQLVAAINRDSQAEFMHVRVTLPPRPTTPTPTPTRYVHKFCSRAGCYRKRKKRVAPVAVAGIISTLLGLVVGGGSGAIAGYFAGNNVEDIELELAELDSWIKDRLWEHKQDIVNLGHVDRKFNTRLTVTQDVLASSVETIAANAHYIRHSEQRIVRLLKLMEGAEVNQKQMRIYTNMIQIYFLKIVLAKQIVNWEIYMYTTYAERVMAGIHTMIYSQRLDIKILSNPEVQSMLIEISKYLDQYLPSLQVPMYVYTSRYLYQQRVVTQVKLTMEGYEMTLDIPVVSRNPPLQVYQIKTLELPQETDTDEEKYYTSQLDVEHQYIAINEDQGIYARIHAKLVQKCNVIENQYLDCPHKMVVRGMEQKSCELALFQNDTNSIKTLCSPLHHVRTTSLPTLIVEVKATQFVYINYNKRTGNWTWSCPGSEPTHTIGCHQVCTFTLMCNCRLILEELHHNTSVVNAIGPNMKACTESDLYMTWNKFEQQVSNLQDMANETFAIAMSPPEISEAESIAKTRVTRTLKPVPPPSSHLALQKTKVLKQNRDSEFIHPVDETADRDDYFGPNTPRLGQKKQPDWIMIVILVISTIMSLACMCCMYKCIIQKCRNSNANSNARENIELSHMSNRRRRKHRRGHRSRSRDRQETSTASSIEEDPEVSGDSVRTSRKERFERSASSSRRRSSSLPVTNRDSRETIYNEDRESVCSYNKPTSNLKGSLSTSDLLYYTPEQVTIMNELRKSTHSIPSEKYLYHLDTKGPDTHLARRSVQFADQVRNHPEPMYTRSILKNNRPGHSLETGKMDLNLDPQTRKLVNQWYTPEEARKEKELLDAFQKKYMKAQYKSSNDRNPLEGLQSEPINTCNTCGITGSSCKCTSYQSNWKPMPSLSTPPTPTGNMEIDQYEYAKWESLKSAEVERHRRESNCDAGQIVQDRNQSDLSKNWENNETYVPFSYAPKTQSQASVRCAIPSAPSPPLELDYGKDSQKFRTVTTGKSRGLGSSRHASNR